MRDIKRLIHEIHRRSLWQVLAIYLGASWAVVQAADHVVKQFALPQWTYGMVFLLLLIGLPIVLATAFIQEHPASDEEAGSGAPAVRAGASPTRGGRTGGGDEWRWSDLFTWRNAIAGGVAALALWGLVAGAWVLVAGGAPRGIDSGVASWTSRDDPIEADAGAAGNRTEEGEASGPDALREGEVATASDADSVAPAAGEGEVAAPSREAVAAGGDEARAEEAGDREEARTAPPRARPSAVATPPPSYRRAMERAASEREAALRAGAQATAGRSLDRGDSLFTAGLRESGRNRHPQAEQLMQAAAMAFDRARREAASAWSARLDSARAAIALRQAEADPEAEEYGEATELEERAGREAEAGAYEEALASLRRAAALYEEARLPTDVATERAGEEPPPREGAAGGRDDEADAAGERAEAEAGDGGGPPPRGALEDLFGSLAAAFAAEDLDAVQRIWVNLTAEQIRNFRSFFRSYEDIDVSFEVAWESLHTTDGRTELAVATTWRYVDASTGRPERPPSFEQRFEIVERDGRRVLLSR